MRKERTYAAAPHANVMCVTTTTTTRKGGRGGGARETRPSYSQKPTTHYSVRKPRGGKLGARTYVDVVCVTTTRKGTQGRAIDKRDVSVAS